MEIISICVTVFDGDAIKSFKFCEIDKISSISNSIALNARAMAVYSENVLRMIFTTKSTYTQVDGLGENPRESHH